MSDLPQWASTALAARCARLLAPRLHTQWPNMPTEVGQLFESAVTGAESAASRGSVSDELGTLEMELTKTVGMFVLNLSGLAEGITRPMPSYEAMRDLMPTNKADVEIVRNILDVGARTARAAASKSESSAYREAMDAVSWTLSVLEDVQDTGLHDHVLSINERLHAICEVNGAAKDTTVRWNEHDWEVSIPQRPWWRLW